MPIGLTTEQEATLGKRLLRYETSRRAGWSHSPEREDWMRDFEVQREAKSKTQADAIVIALGRRWSRDRLIRLAWFAAMIDNGDRIALPYSPGELTYYRIPLEAYTDRELLGIIYRFFIA